MVQLSDEQWRVVGCRPDGGHLLVLAAPGSGKTLTIVERIRHLLGGRDVDPESVLAMTFTRRAADELRGRLGRADVWAGTFHHVSADLVKDHGRVIGWEPPLRIFDEVRQRRVLEEATVAAGFTPDPENDQARDRFFRELKRRIGRRKQRGMTFDQGGGWDRIDDDVVAEIDAVYCRILHDAHALDFDDLIARAIDVLRNPETARILHRRLRFVFLDEFHDVSPEQYELVRLLAPPKRPGGQVMAVADADQAIFGWRGADAPRMLAQYRRDYAPSEHPLRQNFRSTGRIVAASRGVLADQAMSCRAPSARDDGYRVLCQGLSTESAEVDALLRLMDRARAAGHGYGDIAVLYRKHARADAAEAALLGRNVPVWRVQPNRFFARPDVQEALRYLELVRSLHDDCFVPALNWPRVIVDEPTMTRLRRIASDANVSLAEVARRIDEFPDHVGPLARAAVRDFLDTVDVGLAPLIDRPINEVVERLLVLLDRRRCPIPIACREDLHGVLDFLAQPLQPAVAALLAAVSAGRPVALRCGANADAIAAAVILEWLLRRYLGHPVFMLGDSAAPSGAFEIVLGNEQAVNADGFGLVARRTRNFAYSLGTLAWRIGQMVLIRNETADRDRFVLFDLETGSRHPSLAEILDVGAQPMRFGEHEGDGFSSLVRPSGPEAISAGAFNAHGLRWGQLRSAPSGTEVIPKFLDFLGDSVLVGHNIESFDYPVLQRAARSTGLPTPKHALIDTWKMARRLMPNAASHRLIDLARSFDPGARQDHRALSDARLNGRVFDRLLAVARRERELDALGELLPLVALSIRAAGVPTDDENASLVGAGVRGAALGQGAESLERWRSLVGPRRADEDLAWLNGQRTTVSDDNEWQESVTAWRGAIDAYLGVAADSSLDAFLHYAALAESIDYVPTSEGKTDKADSLPDPRRVPASERVAMMTIHSAKGKEWPIVFILGTDDESFGQRHDGLEEDRRVLYVGMTRAKHRLCLLWAEETANGRRRLSPFLHGLPAEVLDRRP